MQESLQAVGQQVVQVVLGLIVLVVGIFLTRQLKRLLAELEAQTGIKLDADDRAEIDRALKLAIGYAEELAHRALKLGVPMKPEEKMEAAVSSFAQHGFDIETEEVEPLLAAKLGEMRLHGRSTASSNKE